ncbi:MAG: glycosyltransferase family 39 protein [Phycisphaerae bacterium]|nr:glycosyltransferase family 39 protein [Phycisphaerae bacterium]
MHKLVIAVLLLLIAGGLLFARLGHHPLWDDEATTALYAKSIWFTGDAHALVDHNLIAFKQGAELRNLRNRYMPPLGFWVAAPFVGILGDTALAARLPFALCGWLTIVLIVWWLWREKAETLTWLLMALGILGNVSFMLFARQCRYYALTTLLSALLAYLYLHREKRFPRSLTVGLAFVALLASNYLSYLALCGCALVDYLFWGRRDRPLRLVDWVGVLTPQIFLGSAVLYVWNPLIAKRIWGASSASWLSERLTLLWWNLRELNGCEFGVGTLLLAAPLLALIMKDRWLLRASVALLAYVIVVTIASPQQVGVTGLATVRYLVPLIPLCIFIGVRVIQVLTAGRAWLALPLALVAFQTNLLHGGRYATLGMRTAFSDVLRHNRLRCTPLEYLRELRSPPPSTYQAVSQWIDRNVTQGQSIWVLPNYATYPLMFLSRKPVYAWQLAWPPQDQFKSLDEIHFFGRKPPDFVIVFGPSLTELRPFLADRAYVRAATIDRFWADLIRPEMHFHAFRPVTDFDRSDQAVYVFKRRAVARGARDSSQSLPLPL